MKKYLKQSFFAAASVVLLAACNVKDTIYDTEHPSHGTVTLTTDWSHIGTGLTAPASYTVKVGYFEAPVSGTSNTIDYLFAPDTYRILVYNTPEQITVSGSEATVVAPSGDVANMPGWLFTAAQDVVIEKDTDLAIMATMQQQVRELTLVISPTGGATDRIERIESTLSGVAGTLNLANGTHAEPSKVSPTFTRITEGADAGKWSATVRLLGTAGAEQKLRAKLLFSGNSPTPVFLDSDLSALLADFNANKREPLTLGSQVVETPTGVGFTTSITDWKVVNGGQVEAN